MTSRTILIVDDDNDLRSTLVEQLSLYEEFDVLEEATAAKGVAAARGGVVDLLIMDVGLPDIGGFALCRELRRVGAGEGRELPVIFLTAHDAEAERILGLEIGADDYVTKPFSPRELVARVRVVLRRGQAAAAVVRGFEHDAEGHRIRYRGSLLDLTRYEYGLLAALLQRPGAVLSRAQLMDRVWGDALESGDRTIDTHVKTLRAKLRAVASDADPIRTHRGLGYSLEPA